MSQQEPYDFQRSVSTLFNAGKDVLLQAPTGAGKTRAVLEPGMVGLAHDLDSRSKSADYPPRIIYAVPMRTLARGFYETYSKISRKNEWGTVLEPRIQTGEQPEDELFSGKLIFATVDQMLASFLNVPYGLPRRLDNINAGALIGSYLIFDEVHLYPRREMLLTTLAMLRMLTGISHFAMMSATLSRPFIKAIANVLALDDAQIIAESEPPALSRFNDVRSVQTQQRTWHAADGSLTAEIVRRLHRRRTLCICNTVDRAQALYEALRVLLPKVEIVLLHSRFYPQDRRAIEDHLLIKDDQHDDQRSYFERSNSIILVATQVVEVGLDISADVLLTECAPASSLIQRAGRCARRENEAGDIYVFQPYDDEGSLNYAPYVEDGFEDVCRKTWEALTDSAFDSQVLRFADEQHLVDRAHGEADAEFLYGLGSKVDTQIGKICDAIRTRDPGMPTTLIRKSTTFPLYITDQDDPNQDSKLTEHPQMLQAFSLSKGALSHLFKRLEAEQDLPFLLAGSDGSAQTSSDDDGQTVSHYYWVKLGSEQEIYQQRWFAVNQWAIQYHPKIGLRLLPAMNTPAPSSSKLELSPHERIAYAAERYHEHIQGLSWSYQRPDNVHQFTPLRDEALYPLRRLCKRYGFDPELGERLLRLTLALHDVGKLNRPWQSWAAEWQNTYAATGLSPTRTSADMPLAHTDYDPSDSEQRELQNKFNKGRAPRGTHAVESAEACLAVIRAAAQNNPLWVAVVAAAIMRHHTPDAVTCGAFKMFDGADQALHRAFIACDFTVTDADRWLPLINRDFSESNMILQKCADYVQPQHSDWRAALVYFLFVRILRLADQRSGMYWSHFRLLNE